MLKPFHYLSTDSYLSLFVSFACKDISLHILFDFWKWIFDP